VTTSQRGTETGAAHDGQCPVRHDYQFIFPGERAPGSGFEELDALRQQSGPIFRTEIADGFFVVADYENALKTLQDPLVFSNSVTIPTEPNPPFKMIPIQLDPPLHKKWREVLGRYFTPKRAQEMVPNIRQRCIELIEGFSGDQRCEFLSDFARAFPTSIFVEMLGLPMAELPMFVEWEALITAGTMESDPTGSRRANAGRELGAYLGELLDGRAAGYGDGTDLVSQALSWEIDGQRPSRDDLISCLVLLFIAGLDTVAVQLGWCFYHLASCVEDRVALVRNPDLIPNAIEEMMRAFSILQLARKATEDTFVGGCPVGAGQLLLIPLSAANRDPRAFENPGIVDIRRKDVRHLGFGAGPHRCVGSHLARQELRIALEEWHRRIPDFEIDPDADPVTEYNSGIFGLARLPLRWPSQHGSSGVSMS
jgi:cytochrome P450